MKKLLYYKNLTIITISIGILTCGYFFTSMEKIEQNAKNASYDYKKILYNRAHDQYLNLLYSAIIFSSLTVLIYGIGKNSSKK